MDKSNKQTWTLLKEQRTHLPVNDVLTRLTQQALRIQKLFILNQITKIEQTLPIHMAAVLRVPSGKERVDVLKKQLNQVKKQLLSGESNGK